MTEQIDQEHTQKQSPECQTQKEGFDRDNHRHRIQHNRQQCIAESRLQIIAYRVNTLPDKKEANIILA